MWWLLLIAVELVALGLRLKARSIRVRRVAILRLVTAGLFLVAVSSGVIEWGLRCVPVAVWLVLSAAFAIRTLLATEPAHAAPERRGRIVLRSVGTLTVTCVVLLPAILFPPYEPIEPSGPLAVRTVVIDVDVQAEGTGRSERRVVPVEIWYPAESRGSFPLVTFSHGAFGTRSSNRSMYADLASNGYVVAALDHPGHALFSTDSHGGRDWIDSTYARALMAEDARRDPVGSLRLYREWMGTRVADLDAVIDHILTQSAKQSARVPYRLVDGNSVGAIGHSLGGSAALALGRARSDIDVVVALEAPFMGDIDDVERGRFTWNPTPYPAALLMVYSDGIWDHLDEWPQYERNVEMLADPPAGVTNVHLTGVGHLGLTDLSLASPILTRILDGGPQAVPARKALKRLNRICLRFLDRHL